jgi:protein-L-isoaspartate O-methyltransferase
MIDIVGAYIESIPEALLDQLQVDGAIFIPTG